MRQAPTNSAGFTLVELLAVLVLLGLLAAVALPRLTAMSTDSRKASGASASAALQAGVAMAHGKWLAQGQPKFITLDNGGKLYFNASGWPVSTGGSTVDANGWPTLAGINSHCTAVFAALLGSASVVDKNLVDTAVAKATDYDWCARAGNRGGDPVNIEQCNFTMTRPWNQCYPSSPAGWINYDAQTGQTTAVNF